MTLQRSIPQWLLLNGRVRVLSGYRMTSYIDRKPKQSHMLLIIRSKSRRHSWKEVFSLCCKPVNTFADCTCLPQESAANPPSDANLAI